MTTADNATGSAIRSNSPAILRENAPLKRTSFLTTNDNIKVPTRFESVTPASDAAAHSGMMAATASDVVGYTVLIT